MPKRTSDYRGWLLNQLADPVVAANYLNAAIKDSRKMFLTALRNVAEARQMSRVARHSRLSRENLYRMLSGGGNPTLTSLEAVLKTVGLRFSVEPLSLTSRAVLTAKTQLSAVNVFPASQTLRNLSGVGTMLGGYTSQVASLSWNPPLMQGGAGISDLPAHDIQTDGLRPEKLEFKQEEYQKLAQGSMPHGETQRPQSYA